MTFLLISFYSPKCSFRMPQHTCTHAHTILQECYRYHLIICHWWLQFLQKWIIHDYPNSGILSVLFLGLTHYFSLFKLLYKKYLRLCGPKTFISYSLQAGESKIKVPQYSLSDEGTYFLVHKELSFCFVLTEQKGQRNSLWSLLKGHLVHSWGHHPHDLIIS